MQKVLILGVALSAAALASCHKSGANAERQSPKPSDSAIVNTAQDVAATGVGVASASTAGGFNTKAFVMNAAIGDSYEIAAANIALQRTKSPEVKSFATMMITDHGKLDAQLKKAVADKRIDAPIPTELDARRTGMINNLKASGDSDFDLAYLHQQLAAHVETLDLMKGFQNHGDNDALKMVASEAAPIVQHHLGMVRDVGGDKLKGAQ